MDIYNEFRYRCYKHREKKNLVVLMPIADFYETYDDCAKWSVGVLGLKHTEQVKPDKTRHVVVGFPKRMLDEYVARLKGAGCSVVVLDKELNEIVNYNNNSNNQKTTTTMEQNFAAMNKTNVYWFNRDREALVQLVLVRSSFNLDSHKARHEWAEKDGDPEKVVLVIDYDPQEPGKLPLFYATTEAFEKGKAMNSDEMLWMRDEKDVCDDLLSGQYSRRVFADEKGAYIWAYVKGQAVKWYFRKHIDVVTRHYANGTIDKVTSDAEGGVPVSYSSVEEVYQFNDWTEVTEQGERITHEGVYNRLRLEPDQEELAKKLQAVLDECKAAGMNVYFNLCNYELNAVNMRHIGRIEYDPEVDEDTELAYEFDDGRAGHTFSGVYDLNSEDSSLMFVIKKQ